MSWGEFSPKALQSIEESTARLNIWWGAVRSSKTVCSLVRWIEFIQTAPPGELLMAGKTERTLKRNILDPLSEIVGPRRFRYNRGMGEAELLGRRVYIAGANDERAEGKIRGMTIAGAYGDEITLWPESFFKMLLSRLSVEGAKFFGTTNTDSPYHYLKQEYLDNGELDLNQWHFKIEDNYNLPPEYVDNLKREYSGLWYKRLIDGLWVLAEGAVYDMFDEDYHVIDERPAEPTSYYVSIDYGTGNPTAFGLYAVNGNMAWKEKEYFYDHTRHGRQKTDAEFSQDLKDFLGNIRPRAIIVDPSALSFKTQLKKDGFANVKDADNEVVDGIRTQASMLQQGRYFVMRNCTETIREYSGYVWDAKAQERGEDKPLKQNDHTKDEERYFLHTVFGGKNKLRTMSKKALDL